MVVLARAAGLPARLVVGYASGAYDAESARYIVTADQSHAWVQVYFP
ncbi:MAG: protease, partial [Chloroflexi bacterium]